MRRRFRGIVTKALRLTPRGFIPNDVLVLTKLSGQLQVEWLARDIHRWDRRSPASRDGRLFRDQTAGDTDTTIVRFFEMLPDIDTIDVRVCEPRAPNRPILAGTVVRQDALASRSLLSPRMRLSMMGLRWLIDDADPQSSVDAGTSTPPIGASSA